MNDTEYLASVIEGEAGGEGVSGMIAVANVIANRAARNFRGYGADLVSQAKAPSQFQGRRSPSSTALAVARYLVSGDLPDVTRGAIFYANPSSSTAAWAQALNESNSLRIGRHFFTSRDAEPYISPQGSEDPAQAAARVQQNDQTASRLPAAAPEQVASAPAPKAPAPPEFRGAPGAPHAHIKIVEDGRQIYPDPHEKVYPAEPAAPGTAVAYDDQISRHPPAATAEPAAPGTAVAYDDQISRHPPAATPGRREAVVAAAAARPEPKPSVHVSVARRPAARVTERHRAYAASTVARATAAGAQPEAWHGPSLTAGAVPSPVFGGASQEAAISGAGAEAAGLRFSVTVTASIHS